LAAAVEEVIAKEKGHEVKVYTHSYPEKKPGSSPLARNKFLGVVEDHMKIGTDTKRLNASFPVARTRSPAATKSIKKVGLPGTSALQERSIATNLFGVQRRSATPRKSHWHHSQHQSRHQIRHMRFRSMYEN